MKPFRKLIRRGFFIFSTGITSAAVLKKPNLFNLMNSGRFGLDTGGEERTQREIAKELGISRSYVSRIEKRALMKLYHEFYKAKR